MPIASRLLLLLAFLTLASAAQGFVVPRGLPLPCPSQVAVDVCEAPAPLLRPASLPRLDCAAEPVLPALLLGVESSRAAPCRRPADSRAEAPAQQALGLLPWRPPRV